jgi:uncharacterized membrane protein
VNAASGRHARMERTLATVLHRGTWLGSLMIAAGLVLQLFDVAGSGRGTHLGATLVNLGVALFILLPVVRVAVMLAVFGRDRDYRYAAIAGTVLAIVAVGALLGWRWSVSGG